MVFELDPCRVHAPTGELLARGFVREHGAHSLLVEAEHFSGGWLAEGDDAVVEVLSDHRGTCTYDAVVAFSAAGRIELRDLRLREVVQQRTAVRVPVAVPIHVTQRLEGTELVPLDEPLDIHVLDVSAHGMRIRCARQIEAGTRLAVRFTQSRAPLDLVVEVLRAQELRGEFAHGCRIVGASERVTDELFRFVLDEQRRQLAQRSEQRA